MESRTPIKRGYLTSCVQTGSPNIGVRFIKAVKDKLSDQNRWYVLRQSPMGTGTSLDYFKDEKSAQAEKLLGFISLAKVSDVYQDKKDGRKFTLHTGIEMQTFKCISMVDAEEWVATLKQFVSNSPRFRQRRTASLPSSSLQTLEGKFVVSLLSGQASTKLGFSGRCHLQVTARDIVLRDAGDRRTIEKWPLHLIRKYGNNNDRFSFESGSRCHSGVGVFTFSTFENDAADRIHDIVHTNSEALADEAETTDPHRYTKSLPRPPTSATPAPTYEPLQLSKLAEKPTASNYEPLKLTSKKIPNQQSHYQPLQSASPTLKTANSARSEYQPLTKK
eukprot:m.308652 g.308652  ORF g.308652 m.308652 type:complete len:333 (+) comp44440_c0_seq1:46-1044(+)